MAAEGRGRKWRRPGRIRRRHVWLGFPLPARGGGAGNSGRSAAGPSPRFFLSGRFVARPRAAAGCGGGDMSDLGDWFRSIPLITRYWFAGSIAVPLIGKLGLVSPVYLFLWPDAFINRFQIWRPITATFFFPVGPGTGFLYLVNLYFLYQYSSRLETGAFDGRPADYMFMLLFNWICIVITGLAMDMQLLMIPLIMSVLYVWAQLNRDMIVSFWFGTRFKACYLPWVILGFNYIIGGSAYTAPRAFLLLTPPHQRAAGGAQGVGRGHSRDNWPQLTTGTFHTIGWHAQHIKLGEEEGREGHSD